jgi:peptidylprolyl isomerase
VKGLPRTMYALKYIDIKVGTGELAPATGIFTVHYTGWLAADGKKFDSSVDRGEPAKFPVGAHRVIVGWDTGFAGMRVGGKRRLLIPYQLAYGETGRPPVIPAKANLIFDVELIAVAPLPQGPPPGGRPQGAGPGGARPQGAPPTGGTTPPAGTPPPAGATPPAGTTPPPGNAPPSGTTSPATPQAAPQGTGPSAKIPPTFDK